MRTASARQRRETKKQKKKKQLNAKCEKERQLLKDLLVDWHLWEFAGDTDLVQKFLAERGSVPVLHMANPQSLGANQVLQHVQDFMKFNRYQPDGLNRAYTSTEFLRTVRPAIIVLSRSRCLATKSERERKLMQSLRKAQELASKKIIDDFESWMSVRIREILVGQGRMNHSLYCINRVGASNETRKGELVWEIQEVNSDRTTFEIDGEYRSVLRCGHTDRWCGIFGMPGVDWVTWDSVQLNLDGPSRQLPDYIQPHVFERLYGREGRLKFLAHDEPMLHYGVYFALRKPRIHPRSGDPRSFLVEYGPPGCKLGYLVCQILPEAVVVRTFLFITMDGTPEGDKLYERLRINRYDKSHLGLDNLEILVSTDIPSDPVLRSIFDDCKLSHLFDALEFHGTLTSGYAATCRSYLRIKDQE